MVLVGLVELFAADVQGIGGQYGANSPQPRAVVCAVDQFKCGIHDLLPHFWRDLIAVLNSPFDKLQVVS